MKNRLSFLFVLMLAAAGMHAQSFAIRPQVGVNFSSLENIGDAVSFKEGTGYQIGLDLVLGRRFYIQPGLMYELTKNTRQDNLPGDLTESKFSVNRVRIPLIFGYKLLDPRNSNFLNLRLFTGPNASFVTNVSEDEVIFDIDKDDFKTTVFGWNAGAGLDLSILFVDLNYQFGLSEVFEDLNITGIEGDNSKNNLFYLNAGIRVQF